jgi:uncharacterized membrane protein
METMYLILKLVHVAGVVLFLGNITVGVFWKNFADRTRNALLMASTMDGIIEADRIFTIPGAVLLLGGGLAAAFVGGIPILTTGWLLWALVAFVLSGLAFGPLAMTQRRLAAEAHAGDLREYHRLSRSWNLWGSIALGFPIVAFVLMILKPALPAFHPTP